MATKTIFKNKQWLVEWENKDNIRVQKLQRPFPIGGGENFAFVWQGHIAYYFSVHSYIPDYIKKKVESAFKAKGKL